MNGMQIAKLIKKKNRLLVLLNDYDTGYHISVVVLNQNFEVIENVPERIGEQWFDGWEWNRQAIILYLAKYGDEYEIIFKTFSDGRLVVDEDFKESKNADEK